MWVLIPFAVFILCWAALHKRGFSFSEVFFISAAFFSTIIIVSTEILSPFHLLAFLPLLIFWLLALATSLYWAGLDASFLGRIFSCLKGISQWALTEKLFLSLLVLIAGLKAYSALMSAPNTADAMTYHLSRVEHWIQDGTLQYYPSYILRQLYSPPWPEYVIMHLRILSGGDYFSNAVQWFAGVGSWIGVAALARCLGADRRGQLLSAVLAATLPMGLVQLTSTQTDDVLTFWMVGFVYLLFMSYQQGKGLQIFGATICLGTALLVKGNAYLFAPAWIILYLIVAVSRREGIKLKWLGLIVMVALIVIIPYGLRNTFAFGKPNWSELPLTNGSMPGASLASNAVDNIALELATPWPGLNASIENGLDGFGRLAGLDLVHPDPRSDGETYSFHPWSTGEDDSGNSLYVFLLAFVILIMALYRPFVRRGQWMYVAALALSFIIFCRFVRYHEFNHRYHLALFVLSCPLAGVVLADLLRRWAFLIGVLVFVTCWPWLMQCNEHPFLGNKSILSTTRSQQYFSEQPYLMFPYTTIIQGVQTLNCRDVGLIEGENNLEYPWWVLLHQAYGSRFRLEDVQVNNASAHLANPLGAFDPCMLIADNDPRTLIVLPQGVYARVWFMDLPQQLTSVFIKKQ